MSKPDREVRKRLKRRAPKWHRETGVYPNGSDYVTLRYASLVVSVSKIKDGFIVTCGPLGMAFRKIGAEATDWESAERLARLLVEQRAAELVCAMAKTRTEEGRQ